MKIVSTLMLTVLFTCGTLNGDETQGNQYEYEKRFLFETTTSHFADRNLAVMEAAIKELGARVQRLENANNLEESLSYRLDREFKAMQTELSHQRAITDRLNDMYFNIAKVRLVDSSGQTNTIRGTVEIFHNNTWGTVCDDSFGYEEARVVCRMLGWTNPSPNHYDSAHFGQGHGPVLLDDLGCSGTEKALWDCSNPGWYIENCSHGEDAGVTCF